MAPISHLHAFAKRSDQNTTWIILGGAVGVFVLIGILGLVTVQVRNRAHQKRQLLQEKRASLTKTQGKGKYTKLSKVDSDIVPEAHELMANAERSHGVESTHPRSHSHFDFQSKSRSSSPSINKPQSIPLQDRPRGRSASPLPLPHPYAARNLSVEPNDDPFSDSQTTGRRSVSLESTRHLLQETSLFPPLPLPTAAAVAHSDSGSVTPPFDRQPRSQSRSLSRTRGFSNADTGGRNHDGSLEASLIISRNASMLRPNWEGTLAELH